LVGKFITVTNGDPFESEHFTQIEKIKFIFDAEPQENWQCSCHRCQIGQHGPHPIDGVQLTGVIADDD